MRKVVRFAAALAAVAAFPAQAALIGVAGGNSNSGDAAAIIGAPADVRDDAAMNTAQQGFDERQGVALAAALGVDGGNIAAGTVVDSHMIFFNTRGNALGVQADVVWTFSGQILGVMSDSKGTLEAASSALLGSPTTTYPGSFNARGLESGANSGDGYTVNGNQITVSMRVTEPGDWIRVITAASVPEPGSLALLGAGLLGLGVLGRKKAG